MNGGKQPRGYTIVEVMIVLAISGVMFLVAAIFISGKQETTSFHAGVTEMTSRIQDVIEQVNDGQYSDIPINCTSTGSNLTFTDQGTQGTNSSCTFIGKLFHFSEAGNIEKYEVFSLAGLRLTNTGDTVSALADADVTPVYGSNPSYPIDLTQQETTPQSLDVKDVCITFSGTPAGGCGGTNQTSQYYGIGFAQGFGNQATFGETSPVSGTQVSSLVYAPISNHAQETDVVAGGGQDISNKVQTAVQATICLTDGTRYGLITIGTNNDELAASSVIGSVPC